MGEAAYKEKPAQEFHDLKTVLEMETFCKSSDMPVRITGTGSKGFYVVSEDALREYRWRQYVDECLAVAEAEFQAGAPTKPLDDIIAKSRKRIADAKK